MAKKKEENKDFVFPKFDEKEYIQKEMLQTKVTFITLGYALLVGVGSFAVSRINQALVPLGFLLGIFAILNLKTLYTKLNIDLSKFEKGNWVGNGFLTFFTWLGVWILLSNPPITDTASPDISHVEFYKVDNATVENGYLVPEGDGYVELSTYGEGYIKSGDIVILKVDIVDNDELEKKSLKVVIQKPDDKKESFSLEETTSQIKEIFRSNVTKKENSTEPDLPFEIKDESYFMAYRFDKGEDLKGVYVFKITAEDKHGNRKSVTKEIIIE